MSGGGRHEPGGYNSGPRESNDRCRGRDDRGVSRNYCGRVRNDYGRPNNNYSRERNDHGGGTNYCSDFYMAEGVSSVAVRRGNFVFWHPLHSPAMDKVGELSLEVAKLKNKLEENAEDKTKLLDKNVSLKKKNAEKVLKIKLSEADVEIEKRNWRASVASLHEKNAGKVKKIKMLEVDLEMRGGNVKY